MGRRWRSTWVRRLALSGYGHTKTANSLQVSTLQYCDISIRLLELRSRAIRRLSIVEQVRQLHLHSLLLEENLNLTSHQLQVIMGLVSRRQPFLKDGGCVSWEKGEMRGRGERRKEEAEEKCDLVMCTLVCRKSKISQVEQRLILYVDFKLFWFGVFISC